MMDRRSAIKHLGGAASALLLTETMHAGGVCNLTDYGVAIQIDDLDAIRVRHVQAASFGIDR